MSTHVNDLPRITRRVGQHDIVARDDGTLGWSVTIDGADWASGLEQRVALAVVDVLATAYPDACPVCGRYVRFIGNRRAPHNQMVSVPGRKGRVCPGSGMGVGR